MKKKRLKHPKKYSRVMMMNFPRLSGYIVKANVRVTMEREGGLM